ncbi:MAG TPA: hypothetical protein VI522_02260 [Gammaproteobacteria bacterium]|nr:hypothetical protein [Gammaproteobacteria bacterium]
MWTLRNNALFSADGEYKITNSGDKGGQQYCLWERYNQPPAPDCFCVLKRMGTLEECKNASRDIA